MQQSVAQKQRTKNNKMKNVQENKKTEGQKTRRAAKGECGQGNASKKFKKIYFYMRKNMYIYIYIFVDISKPLYK